MAGGGEELTAEQRALAQMVCQEWVGYGLTLQPADRATAEAGVGLVYRAAWTFGMFAEDYHPAVQT